MGTGPTRVYRPDLSEHYILVHPKRQWGLIRWNADKTKALIQNYRFDEDGDMRVGRREWQILKTSDKGPYIERQSRRCYIHDFIRPLPNPYA